MTLLLLCLQAVVEPGASAPAPCERARFLTASTTGAFVAVGDDGAVHFLDGVTLRPRGKVDVDATAVVFDARDAEAFKAGSLPGARNLVVADVVKAKDDGRLPMEDHNTRIIVLGRDGEQARAVAEEIARNAFHNVTYFNGGIDIVLTMVQ